MTTRIQDIEKDLWAAADELRANSKLSSQEYSVPVLGLIFLRYADSRFAHATAELEAEQAQASSRRRRREIGRMDYQARGVLYLPPEARFANLLQLPESANIGEAINNAMRAIEAENSSLKDVLPKAYLRLANDTLFTLLKRFNAIPMDIEGDVFGRIYEYFLSQFAMGEGRRGGEFFTPTSLVRLIVEVIEPFHGRILDPACGSGGMFVQSARFVREHQAPQVPGTSQVPGTLSTLSIYGQERVNQTIRLCQMNLAVHGLEGNIKQANTFYEDAHNITGKFDFVMANPPFNVNNVDKERLEGDPRYPLGLPRTDNANYLWIQLFATALSERGRAGFVMANSASDARHSEELIRQKLLQAGLVDVMIAIGSNFFYTVTLPCTLWFFDKGKPDVGAQRAAPLQNTAPPRSRDTILFIDARRLYRQVSRAHRDFTQEQMNFIADIVRLYRRQDVAMDGRGIPIVGWRNGAKTMADLFPGGAYADVPGLCKVATLAEIEQQGWSLNPGRFVGVSEQMADDDFDFFALLGELNEELELLNADASQLESAIALNVMQLLDGVTL